MVIILKFQVPELLTTWLFIICSYIFQVLKSDWLVCNSSGFLSPHFEDANITLTLLQSSGTSSFGQELLLLLEPPRFLHLFLLTLWVEFYQDLLTFFLIHWSLFKFPSSLFTYCDLSPFSFLFICFIAILLVIVIVEFARLMQNRYWTLPFFFESFLNSSLWQRKLKQVKLYPAVLVGEHCGKLSVGWLYCK